MADVKWTDAQKMAIETVGKDILVSAGAGAGKTAVLTARCIHLTTEYQPTSDINRILVVTFTEAAAGEMRERIGNRLRERLEREGEASSKSRRYRHLRRQLTLLDQAPIKTLHSFCTSLLREFFYELNIDPLFKVLDDEEASLLRHDVLEEVFEEFYSRADERGMQFRALVEHYGGSKVDGSLQESLLSLHDFLTGLSDPDAWLERVRKTYQAVVDGTIDFNSLPWAKGLTEYQRTELGIHFSGFQAILEFELSTKYPRYYDDASLILDNLRFLLKNIEVRAIDTVARRVDEYTMPRLPTEKNVDPEVKEKYMAARNDLKKLLKSEVLGNTKERWLDGLRTVAPHALMLCDAYQTFREAYSNAKRKQNSIDFSDMEHLALKLLRSGEMATILKQRFDHVLVDEYQDINGVQDEIIRLVSRSPSERNIFLVGDIKQSIYGFRQADPSLFLDKHEQYFNHEGDDCVLIPLKENFRSRRSIIDGVNSLFRFLMVPEVAEMRYDETHELTCRADYPNSAHPTFRDHRIEVHIMEKVLQQEENDSTPDDIETIEDWDAAEREAYFTGKRIQELMSSKEPVCVWDDRQKIYRPLSYRDIVILLRTTKERARLYADVLKRFGIPVYAEAKSGYFTATEIQDMRSLLTVLDNPRQDIPLAAVMRSPLFNFSETELLTIRHENRDDDLFEAVLRYGQKDDALGSKCSRFLIQIDEWRTFARRNPLSTLIGYLMRSTGYMAYVSGLPNGSQRKANLLRLHNRSIQFDGFQKQGLSRFIQFIDRLDELGTDYGEAPHLSEAEDVVRIISVHKSKGLEFPVVIVPDLCKGFNRLDEKGDVLFDKDEDLLLGMKAMHLDRKWKHNTLASRIISEGKRKKTLAEEMRLLYVAMTRAREKLILVGTTEIRKMLKQLQTVASMCFDPCKLGHACCYLDWLKPALARQLPMEYVLDCIQDDGSIVEECVAEGGLFDFFLHGSSEVTRWEEVRHSASEPMVPKAKLLALEPVGTGDISQEARETLERVHWDYLYERCLSVPAKLTVSELKRRYATTDEASENSEALRTAPGFYPRPRFLNRAQSLSAAEIGTLTHLVLQHLNLERPCDQESIESQMKEMADRHLLTEEQASVVNTRSIADFFASPLGRRLLAKPDKVRREIAFSLSIPAELVGKEFRGIAEPVLVQGIIDCLLETDMGYVLIDFKTDRVQPEAVNARAQKYSEQMILYRLAVERAFRRPVVETHLYFLYPGMAARMDKSEAL